MARNSKEDYIKSFKALYGRAPNKEELKAFAELLKQEK